MPFSREDKVGNLGWSQDGRGIFVSGSQIGFVSAKGKEFQPITRDANSYHSLTASADGRSLAAIETRSSDALSILDGSGRPASEPIPLHIPKYDEGTTNTLGDFSWTVDRNLLTTDGSRLWKLGRDGKNESLLLGDGTSQILSPAACGAGNIVFSWNVADRANIWRINTDGLGAVKLTSGDGDIYPFCSPDQRWVYYFELSNGSTSILRVLLDGSGKPEVVPGSVPPAGLAFYLTPTTPSPDGETLACILVDSRPRALGDNKPVSSTFTLALLSLQSTNSPRQLDLNPRFADELRFTPDGKAVAYTIREKGVENLWVQPLDGSSGHQITNFSSDSIGEFHWSPDGKNLGIMRSHSESDVVLLQESKP